MFRLGKQTDQKSEYQFLCFSSEDDVSALQFAAIVGHERIAELLIDSGCSVDHYSFNGFTALHCAAKSGHVGIARLLVKRG